MTPDTTRVPESSRSGPWRAVEPYESPETGNLVQPGQIPIRDQLVAYAAELSSAEDRFRGAVVSTFGAEQGGAMLEQMSTDARRAWVQFTLGRPGITHQMDPRGEGFSAYSALEMLHSRGVADLDAILSDEGLGHSVSVQRARTTSLEASMLEDALSGAQVEESTPQVTGER
jgi:hypothetical protein